MVTPVPRMPYGMAKKIVATMRVGDACVVRPEWQISMHNAARRLGMRLASVAVDRPDGMLFRMVRVDALGITGHQVCRIPRREQVGGRWLRKVAA